MYRSHVCIESALNLCVPGLFIVESNFREIHLPQNFLIPKSVVFRVNFRIKEEKPKHSNNFNRSHGIQYKRELFVACSMRTIGISKTTLANKSNKPNLERRKATL